MDASPPGPTPSGRGGRAALLTWGPTILFNVVLPFVTYSGLHNNGMKTVPALAITSAWPALEIGLFYLLHHRVDEFGVIALAFFGLGMASALAFNSARLAVVKDSALTGLFGIVALASLGLARPMMFFLGRRFATDGTPEGVAYWNGLWRYPTFRRAQRVITLVWGVAFLVEAGVRIALSYALSTSTMVLVNSLLPVAVVAALLTATLRYGKRVREAAGAPPVDRRGGDRRAATAA